MKKRKGPKVKVNLNGHEATGVIVADPNGVVAQKDLEAIYRIYQKILKQYGEVTYKNLWEASFLPGNRVLRKYYTQSKEKAAQKWWQQESYRIIRSIHIYIKEVKNAKPMRWLVRVVKPKDLSPGYRPVTSILSHEELMQQLVERAADELRIWQEKYETLTTYAAWFRQMHARVTKIVVGVKVKSERHWADPNDLDEQDGD